MPKEARAQGKVTELGSLVELRQTLSKARIRASSPAVARALQMTDYYLFLGMTYLGYTDKLFPEET